MSLAALVSDIKAAGTITNDGLESVQRKLDRFGVSFLQTTGQVSALHHDLDRRLLYVSCVLTLLMICRKAKDTNFVVAFVCTISTAL